MKRFTWLDFGNITSFQYDANVNRLFFSLYFLGQCGDQKDVNILVLIEQLGVATILKIGQSDLLF